MEAFAQSIRGTLPLTSDVAGDACDQSDLTVTLVTAVFVGILPIIAAAFGIHGLMVLLARLVGCCKASWERHVIPPVGSLENYQAIAEKAQCGKGVHSYLLDFKMDRRTWVPGCELRLKGEFIATDWHYVLYMRGGRAQRVVFSTNMPIAFNLQHIRVEGRLPHGIKIRPTGTLSIPNPVAKLYLPEIGMKWVRITDVKIGDTVFTKCCHDNIRWDTSELTNDHASYFINTSPVVVSMSYLTWSVKNAWIWGPGGPCKAFLTSSRRMILLLSVASCIAIFTLIAPSFRIIDEVDASMPQIFIINLGTISITTDTFVQAAANSLAAFLVVLFNEASFRYLMPVLDYRCCCKNKEKVYADDDPKKYIGQDIVVIDINDDITESRCSCKCFIMHTLTSIVYLLVLTCIVGSLGFVVIVLDGVCYTTLGHFLVTTLIGLLCHAFVYDPLKVVIVVIAKILGKDDMRIYDES